MKIGARKAGRSNSIWTRERIKRHLVQRFYTSFHMSLILMSSGYIIWFAPDILSEAVFGATLAAGLARSAKKQGNEGWVAGVIKKTWWPFAIVLVLAEAVAIFAALNFPKASTLGQALTMALE